MRRLLLTSDEDSCYRWMARHPDKHPAAVVWPGRLKYLDTYPYHVDRLMVSADAAHLDTHIAACLTRVKGPDGLTPGQRLNADEVGARLRGTT
jgi:hypothetical protein